MTANRKAPLDVGSIGGGPGNAKSEPPLVIPNLPDDLARLQAENPACFAEEIWQSHIGLADRLAAQGGRCVYEALQAVKRGERILSVLAGFSRLPRDAGKPRLHS
jgi:hypothetical protein